MKDDSVPDNIQSMVYKYFQKRDSESRKGELSFEASQLKGETGGLRSTMWSAP